MKNYMMKLNKKIINKFQTTFITIKKFIKISLIILFFIPNHVLASDKLEREFNNFKKTTEKIRKKFNSLSSGTLQESIIIDSAIQEMDKVVDFIDDNFTNNNIELAEIALNFMEKSFTDIEKLVPKEIVNDLSKVDINNLPEKNVQKIMLTSKQMQINKKEKLTSLVKNMSAIDQSGLNFFQISNNLNDLGVKTLNFEEIARAVKGDPLLKAEVLKSAETFIEPEKFDELERIADVASEIKDATSEISNVTEGLAGLSSDVQSLATELGIAEATAAAASAAGIEVSEVMPTLETMQDPNFDAEAHNRAMQEKAAGN